MIEYRGLMITEDDGVVEPSNSPWDSRVVLAPNFQRLMNMVLKRLIWTECLCHLDDVLVMGRTLREHNERLERVLTALQNAGLTLHRENVWSEACQVSRIHD